MELKLRYALLNKAFSKVLIVPYGIETCSLFGDLNESYGVNCTLWN